jgi:hypothetical protein
MAAKRLKSRKRSSGKKERLRLKTFVLYLDENLCDCREIIDTLEKTKVKFKRHTDFFPRSTKDPVFLPLLGKKGWTLLTSDSKMSRRGLEMQAIMHYRVRMFVFTSGNLSGAGMARVLKIAHRKMRRFVQKNPPPFIASLTESGAIHLRFDCFGRIHGRAGAPTSSP